MRGEEREEGYQRTCHWLMHESRSISCDAATGYAEDVSFPFRSFPLRDSPPMRISAIVACLTMAGLLFVQQGPAKTNCRARLTLSDADSGKELPGLVRIADADGRVVASDTLLSRGLGLEGSLPIHEWLVVPRAVEFELPAGKYTIRAISGLETEESQLEADLRGT